MFSGTLAEIFGPDGLIVLAVVLVVLLFGGSQLPKLARGLGGASHEFKKAAEEFKHAAEHGEHPEEAAPTAAIAPVPPVAALPEQPAAPEHVKANGAPSSTFDAN